MARTITSANAVFTLAVPLVFPAPVNVEGFGADDAFTTDPVDSAEALMGVDGKMSVGFTPFITKINVVLQADSPSISLFEAWLGAQVAIKDVLLADATISMPSIDRTFIMTKGALTRITQFPGGKKILQPVQYEISFESLVSVPLSTQ